MTPYLRLALLIGFTGLLGPFIIHRFQRAGAWMPPVPSAIGDWSATEVPLPRETLAILNNPQSEAREYINPFGESVRATIIAPRSFDAYHDPTVCTQYYGFRLSGKKVAPVAGMSGGKVRALVFRRFDDTRIIMYYWQQTRGGALDPDSRVDTYKDIGARLRTAVDAVVKGEQTVIVRVYAVVNPGDPQGQQARRNVEEVARGLFRAALREEKGRQRG